MYTFACQPYKKKLLKTGRNTQVFLPAEMGGISAGRFSWLSASLLAEIGGGFLLRFLTGRFDDIH